MESLLLLSALLLPVSFDDDTIKSENNAKSLRKLDGTFTTFDTKSKKSSAAPAADDKDKPKDQDKDKDKESEGKTYKADQVDELKKAEGKQTSVKGKVVEVFVPNSGSLAIMNFGKDNKKCFKVVIRKKDFEKFGGIEDIKKKYAGKEVTVDGKVTMYQSLPQIELTVPSQIKVN